MRSNNGRQSLLQTLCLTVWVGTDPQKDFTYLGNDPRLSISSLLQFLLQFGRNSPNISPDLASTPES
jgi:hypothetical protein